MVIKKIDKFWYILDGTGSGTIGTNDGSKKGNAVDSVDELYDMTLNIPSNVTDPDDGKEYTITTVGVLAFYECKIKDVVFPNTITTILRSAFDWCELKNTPNFPDSLTSVGDWAFSSNRYTTLMISKNLREIGTGSLSYNTVLQTITVDSSNRFYRCDSQGILYDYNFNELILCPIRESIVIPSTVRKIRTAAFTKSTFTKIIFPPSVKSVQATPFTEHNTLDTVIFQGNVVFESGDLLKKIINKFVYYGTKEVSKNIFGSNVPQNITVCSGYKGNKFSQQSFIRDDDCPSFPIPRTLNTCKTTFNKMLAMLIIVLVK